MHESCNPFFHYGHQVLHAFLSLFTSILSTSRAAHDVPHLQEWIVAWTGAKGWECSLYFRLSVTKRF